MIVHLSWAKALYRMLLGLATLPCRQDLARRIRGAVGVEVMPVINVVAGGAELLAGLARGSGAALDLQLRAACKVRGRESLVVLVVAADLDLVVAEVEGPVAGPCLASGVVVVRRPEDRAEAVGDDQRSRGEVPDLRAIAAGDGRELEPILVLRIADVDQRGASEELSQRSRVVHRADRPVRVPDERIGGSQVRDVARPRFGVAEDRADDRRARAQAEGQFAGIDVAGRVEGKILTGRAIQRRGACADGLILVVGDAVVRAEEPDVVLHQEAAEVGAVVLTVLLGAVDDEFGVRPVIGEVRAVCVQDDVRVALVVGGQRLLGEVAERVAMELVAARLGDDVDHAAGGTAVLGFVARCLDLDFLDEFL